MRKVLLPAALLLALWVSNSTPAWGIGWCADLCDANSSCALQCIDPSDNWSTCGAYGLCAAPEAPEVIEEEGEEEAPNCGEETSCSYDWGDCKSRCFTGIVRGGVAYRYDSCRWGPSFYFFRPFVCVYRRL
jgi:hypothetical protein